MENYNMIVAGIIASSITLLLTAILDLCKDRFREKLEFKKLIFQRKTDAVEKAISWLQESIDALRMMQNGCATVDDMYNSIVVEQLCRSSVQAQKLYNNTSVYLNPIYLYYDFRDIESKYNMYEAYEYINYALCEIAKLDQQAADLQNKGFARGCTENVLLQEKAISLYREISKSITSIVDAETEIINRLRQDYSKYHL